MCKTDSKHATYKELVKASRESPADVKKIQLYLSIKSFMNNDAPLVFACFLAIYQYMFDERIDIADKPAGGAGGAGGSAAPACKPLLDFYFDGHRTLHVTVVDGKVTITFYIMLYDTDVRIVLREDIEFTREETDTNKVIIHFDRAKLFGIIQDRLKIILDLKKKKLEATEKEIEMLKAKVNDYHIQKELHLTKMKKEQDPDTKNDYKRLADRFAKREADAQSELDYFQKHGVKQRAVTDNCYLSHQSTTDHVTRIKDGKEKQYRQEVTSYVSAPPVAKR